MARLIDADELLKRLKLYMDKTSLGEITSTTELSVGEICSLIGDCPTADAEPVRRGKRLIIKTTEKNRYGCYGYRVKCSECGYEAAFPNTARIAVRRWRRKTRMSDELKLLPCPFCGGKAKIVYFHESWYIECTKCNAQMGHRYSGFSAVKGQLNFENQEDCIKAWNSRA